MGVILIGCGPKRTGPQEITTPPAPLIQRGYSFTPLNESGWYIFGRAASRIALGKRGKNTDETLAIQGAVIAIKGISSDEEFVHFVGDEMGKNANPERFKVTTQETTPFPHQGATCAYSHFVTEDHAAVKRSNVSGIMILEAFSLMCRHPDNQSRAVNISYSQGYYPQDRDVAIEDKAKALFDSLDFRPL